MTDRIEDLRNLGPRSAEWLRAVGIETAGDVAELGPVEAFCRVRDAHPQTSITLLWALVGAADDVDWRDLDDETKTAALAAVDRADREFGR